MLGRRQIRERIVETLYSYYQNPINYDVLEKNMFTGIEKIYHLYIYELNFLVGLKRLAEHQIEIGKNKFLKTDKDLNPNQKFINNQVLIQIEENEARVSFTAKHKNLQWELHDELLVKTFQRMVSGKRYQDFMNEENCSFEEDQKFIGKLYLKYVAENESLHEHFEEKEIGWADDFHIANSMVQKTIGFMKPDEPSHTLIKMIKDEGDCEFAEKLLKSALNSWEGNEKKIEERLQNWELERISLIDKVILVTAIAELDHFPLTAYKIIINEYVEISKVFGTDKSSIFINGILDKYSKDINRVN
ncbi:MAG: transcription antitermination protein NusB [Bergeyella sp.]